jgi:ABC-type glycerol-3-phosphate transport system substrate-binding protein
MKRVLAAGAVLVMLAACGGGDDGGDEAASTTTAKPTTTVAAEFNADTARTEITTLYTTFFNDQTPIDQAVQMLEDGESLRSALEQQKASGAAAGLTAQVKSVQFRSETQADVVVDLLLKGSPVAPNTKGEAKFIDGRWKVNKALMCTLLGLAGQTPPACAGG